ncbi:MAG: hypothetical protein Q4D74_02925 [Comamonadaceae bacterium]|nr:hypothetical protein [Comamonadaceae bacterium]
MDSEREVTAWLACASLPAAGAEQQGWRHKKSPPCTQCGGLSVFDDCVMAANGWASESPGRRPDHRADRVWPVGVLYPQQPQNLLKTPEQQAKKRMGRSAFIAGLCHARLRNAPENIAIQAVSAA